MKKLILAGSLLDADGGSMKRADSQVNPIGVDWITIVIFQSRSLKNIS